MKSALLLGILGLGLAACSDDKRDTAPVEPDEYFLDYSLDYQTAANILRLDMYFKSKNSNGTYVAIGSSSTLTVNGEAISRTADISSPIYSKVIASPTSDQVAADYVIVYSSGGKTFTNTLKLPTKISYSLSTPSSFSIGSPPTISYSLDAAISQYNFEIFAFVMEDVSGSGSASHKVYTSQGLQNGTFTFEASEVSSLSSSGSGHFWAELTTIMQPLAQVTTAGGQYTTTYEGAQIAVTVVP